MGGGWRLVLYVDAVDGGREGADARTGFSLTNMSNVGRVPTSCAAST